MAAFVVLLSSRKAVDPSLTGGKGAGLARLIRAGFPVPPGFVITTAAFREPLNSAFQLTVSDAGSLSSGNATNAGTLPRINDEAARRFCLSWDIPAAARRAILDAYRRLDGPVAVRSSMVGEDAAAASFAGLLDTVLDVGSEDALLAAVRRVLASAFGDRLRTYLKQAAAGTPAAAPDRKSISTPDPSLRPYFAIPRLAIVVQSMVRAEVSGVAFSVDPVTCHPGVVIEAAAGLGEDLAQGRVRPDRYRLDPRGELDEVLPARPGAPLLSEPLARRLGELVRSVADLAETPQDVEWSWDGGRFQVLQARPI
jgi:pyruvate,water dikinase